MNIEEIKRIIDDATSPGVMTLNEAAEFYEELEVHCGTAAVACREDIERGVEG